MNKCDNKKNYIFYTILFLVIAIVIFYPFYSRGRSLVWMGDGHDQYYPALTYIGHYGRSFLSNLMKGGIKQFDFAIGLGDDVIGCLSYYGFGDPLNWISVFVKPENIAYLYSVLIIFRWWLGGISFIWYSKRRGYNPLGAIAGALTYAFCPYVLSYNLKFGSGFGNILYLLPFAFAGLDDIIERKKKQSLILSCSIALQALCGFYFLYMESIFMIIYFFVRFSAIKFQGREKKQSIKYFCESLVRSIWSYVIGIGMGAVILFPSIEHFLQSSRTNQVKFSWNNFGGLADIDYYENMLMHFFSWDDLGSFGFCVILFPALIILYWNKDYLKDVKWLFIVSIVMYIFPGASYILSAFAYYELRWTSFLFFNAALVIAATFDKIIILSLKQRIITVVGFGIWTALCMGIGIYNGEAKKMLLWRYGVLFLLVCFISASFDVRGLKKNYKLSNRAIRIANTSVLITATVLNIMFCAYQRTGSTKAGGNDWYWQYMTWDELKEEYNLSAANNKTFEDNEEEFYRIDAWDAGKNGGLLFPSYTTSEYFSCMNGEVGRFWENLCISSGLRGTYSYNGLDTRNELDALFSVKYMRPFYGGKRAGNRSEEMKFLPMGIFFEDIITENELGKLAPIDRGGILLQAISVGDEMELPTKDIKSFDVYPRENVNYDIKYDHVNWNQEDSILTVEEGGKIYIYPHWTDRMEVDLQDGDSYTGVVYILFSDLQYDGMVSKVYINGNEISVPKGGNGNNSYLSHIEVDENNVILVNFDTAGEYKLDNIELIIQNQTLLKNQIECRQGITNIFFGTNSIQGEIEVKDNGWILYTIPYSNNWSAYVDGTPVEIVKADYSFCAIPVKAGKHKIYLRYSSPWFILGAVISAGFIIVIITYLLKRHGGNRNEPSSSWNWLCGSCSRCLLCRKRP